ncbi:YifB family Mg chelatase-like AAA ATPase [candidate division WOR-3 bacterium]|nr:YifB family Mg chelatase-like AAA ATPase [candidate division WOR-3 bacterium]
MISKLYSSTLEGINAYIVEVETDLTRSLPALNIVGLPERVVKEAKDRVESAIKNTGIKFPTKRITVNLAPAEKKKETSGFDLPIAVGILAASGDLIASALNKYVVVGEISLSGNVRKINGALSIASITKDRGFKGLILPKQNASEAAIINGIDIIPIDSLMEVLDFLRGDKKIEPHKIDVNELFEIAGKYSEDFSDVKGQQLTKRAIEVAAAGGHNLIMIGPPGSGKTMLAKRISTVLPKMTVDEALETTKIHSSIGSLDFTNGIVATRPFRSPHHTISNIGLIGGGQRIRPGEVSLAHNGVLFLDELPEFNRNVLEVLRQPLENGNVTISRATGSLTFPCRFMLVAAMNPCPCGYFGDPYHTCTCTPNVIQKYMSKISGPLLDRIDIHIEVPSVKYRELTSKNISESSDSIRERVQCAREIQNSRYVNEKSIYSNAHLTVRSVKKYCVLDTESESLLQTAIHKFGFSARAYNRILKVSRTIADLEKSDIIKSKHISEAIQYRSLDRHYWL